MSNAKWPLASDLDSSIIGYFKNMNAIRAVLRMWFHDGLYVFCFFLSFLNKML